MPIAERIRTFLKPGRRLRFTRQGKWFVTMTVMVGFGAINTGNNLLYLTLGMMLGLIVVSGIMSETALRRIHAERISFGAVFCGEQARLEYRVTNGKRRIPSFSIEVEELLDPSRPGGDGQFSGRHWKASRWRPVEKQHWAPRCHVVMVPPAGRRVVRGRVTPPQRGLFRFHALKLSTLFPFGFFEKSLEIGQDLTLMVFPRRVAGLRPRLFGLRSQGEQAPIQIGRGMEYYGLKDYQVGEDVRAIHWKVSARRGTLVVREVEQERHRTMTLAIPNQLPPGGDDQSRESLERAIEVVAAMAERYLAQAYAVTLVTLNGRVPAGTGPGQLYRIRTELALLDVLRQEGPAVFEEIDSRLPSLLVRPAALGPAAVTGRFDRTLVVGADGSVSEER
ncbi:MAG: DUF58 domain-containing protein [Bradymonadales bacterium]|nr:DUF58 domain-containing protein [Bradymonadales bacterium]